MVCGGTLLWGEEHAAKNKSPPIAGFCNTGDYIIGATVRLRLRSIADVFSSPGNCGALQDNGHPRRNWPDKPAAPADAAVRHRR